MGLLSRLLGLGRRVAPEIEDIARMTPPPREIASNGMTIRPSEPFRTSLVGGSDDLAEAASFGRAPDVGNAGDGFDIPVYRGLSRPFDGEFRATTDNIGPMGPGLSASRDAEYARTYGDNLQELQARGPIASETEYKRALSEARQRFDEAMSARGARPPGREVEALAGRILQGRGFTGVESGREVVFFPDADGIVRNVRTPNAPARSNGGLLSRARERRNAGA